MILSSHSLVNKGKITHEYSQTLYNEDRIYSSIKSADSAELKLCRNNSKEREFARDKRLSLSRDTLDFV